MTKTEHISLSSFLGPLYKVAGHFAITAPIEKDNIATLDMSVMHPLSLENGIYHVGGMTLFKKNSTGEHTSDIPTWSLTKVFDSLGPRYWPNSSKVLPRHLAKISLQRARNAGSITDTEGVYFLLGP